MSELRENRLNGHRPYAVSSSPVSSISRHEWLTGSLICLLSIVVLAALILKPSSKIPEISAQASVDGMVKSIARVTTEAVQDLGSSALESYSNAMTLGAKTPPLATAAAPQHRLLKVKSGDTLYNLFIRMGGSASDFEHLMQTVKDRSLLSRLRPNQPIDVYWDTPQHIIQFALRISPTQQLSITRGKDNQTWQSQIISLPVQTANTATTLTLDQSVSVAAIRQHLSLQLIEQISATLGEIIDLRSDIHKGDVLSLVYQQKYVGGKNIHDDTLLALTYHHGSHSNTFIRYDQKPYQGYFDLGGNNLTPGFDRYPIRFTHVSSHFDLHRYHPILHRYRPHMGIDLAARMGTPIHAVADGRISFMGVQGGYGNMIRLRHAHGIVTVYAHMQRYQRHLSVGQLVKRGQVIGYVGQTGLATAPHCHYEFRRYNQPQDPALVKLPVSQQIADNGKSDFNAYADQLLKQLPQTAQASSTPTALS